MSDKRIWNSRMKDSRMKDRRMIDSRMTSRRMIGSGMTSSRMTSSGMADGSASAQDAFDEDIFKETYREAYEHITPDRDCLCRLKDEMEELEDRPRGMMIFGLLKPVAAVSAALCMLIVVFLPIAAKGSAGVYNVIAKYAPFLADFCLPQKYSDSSNGIIMQVEAVQVEGNEAVALVSFSNEEGENKIKGRVDMYDSYSLRSYGAVSNIGSASLLEYDPEEGKAYFKISVTGTDEFDKARLVLKVRMLLTERSSERQTVSLSGLVRNPALKKEALCGLGGNLNILENLPEGNSYFRWTEDESYRPAITVMDIREATADMAEASTIMGIGYQDGILRVQSCRGSFAESDRHGRFYVVDPQGNEKSPDAGFSWHEEVDGERLMFDEDWFLVEEEDLEQIGMYVIIERQEGCVKGNWEVVFGVEE